jgi:hypothetical protein
MDNRGNGILFQRVFEEAGKWHIALIELTNRQKTQHTLEIDKTSALAIEETLKQALSKNEMVWFKELCHVEGSADYWIRFDLKIGKSRNHLTKACSKYIHAIIQKWWVEKPHDSGR